MAGKLSELTVDELISIQGMGISADNFLKNNDFYVKVLKPAIDEQRRTCKIDGEWSPGRSVDTNEIILFNAYNSGKRAGLGAIHLICAKIMARGEDAGHELERRKKNDAKVRP